MVEKETVLEAFQKFVTSTDGWYPHINGDNYVIYMKPSTRRTKSIKAQIWVEGIDLDKLFNFIIDNELSKRWDMFCINCVSLYKIGFEGDIVYYSMKLPSPLKNRDTLAIRFWDKTKNGFVVASTSIDHEDYPKTDKYVRMNSYINGFMVRKDETGRVWIDTAMNVDPCGNVPAWMINILMPRLWKQFYARFFEVYNEYVASTTSRNLESRSFVRKLQKKEQVCPKKIKKIYLYDILDNVTEGPFYDCYTDSTSR